MHVPSACSPVCPARWREPQAPHSVRGPSGPGLLPVVSSALQLHQLHRHTPPSQSRECEPRARNVSNVRLHRSHGKRPSASVDGRPTWPARQRDEQFPHSVLPPSGPGPRALVSSALHSHHPHRHVPPSQRLRCEPSPMIVSKTLSQAWHLYLPSSVRVGGPVWPERKRAEHVCGAIVHRQRSARGGGGAEGKQKLEMGRRSRSRSRSKSQETGAQETGEPKRQESRAVEPRGKSVEGPGSRMPHEVRRWPRVALPSTVAREGVCALTEQSVTAPEGPGPLPVARLVWHHSHRHWPPSQNRR